MNHNRNAHYWENRDERKERAYLHTKNMAYVFSDHIEQCVRNTKLYDDTNTFDELNPVLTREVSVVDLDTVSAIFRYKRKEKRTAILNFASYKNAGGMFLQGSSAQEESLCHASFLYNVLSEFKDYYAWNDKHKNRALYENRALYSPDVVFTNDSVGTLCDVIRVKNSFCLTYCRKRKSRHAYFGCLRSGSFWSGCNRSCTDFQKTFD